jgi:hypothetical protein
VQLVLQPAQPLDVLGLLREERVEARLGRARRVQPPLHAEPLDEAVEPETLADNPDGPDQGGGVRVDLVGRTGEPVSAGCRNVFAERQHRHLGLGGEPADAVGDERGLRGRPARRVDEQRDGREPVGREGPLQSLLHSGGVDHRAGQGAGDRGDHPVQAHERDDRAFGPLAELARELRRKPVGES